MNEYAYEEYRCCQIYAGAQIDPEAGEGLQRGVVYQPVAVIEWHDRTGSHRKLISDPKQRVFARSGDALSIATAMAKHYIDTTSLLADLS